MTSSLQSLLCVYIFSAEHWEMLTFAISCSLTALLKQPTNGVIRQKWFYEGEQVLSLQKPQAAQLISVIYIYIWLWNSTA